MKNFFKKAIVLILTIESKIVLRVHKPLVVAVTGSVGKTGTKDAIYQVLSLFQKTRKSQKSFNSDVGIPLSILALPNAWSSFSLWIKNCFVGLLQIFSLSFPKYLVLEIGADHPRDISIPSKWIKPDYAVFTRFPDVPVHIEFFKDKEEVIKEKKSLAQFTKKTGVLILNHDDPKVLGMKEEFSQKVLTYGESKEATIYLENFHVEKKEGTYCASGSIVFDSQIYRFVVPSILAKTTILSILPGILIAIDLGYEFNHACKAFEQLKPSPGRLGILHGVHNSVLIDDTYNSSPVAVVNSLDVLSHLPETKRRIAVLGDMMELGQYTEEEHRKIGMYAAHTVDVLITVGTRSKFTHDAAQKSGVKEVRFFEDSIKAGEYLKNYIQDGDVVLFKASQSIRLEKALKMCLSNSEDSSLLVRQDKEWINK